MTGSHQRDKSAEAFQCRWSLKEVHQSSCLKQNLFPPRMIRTVVGGGGWTCLGSASVVTPQAQLPVPAGVGRDVLPPHVPEALVSVSRLHSPSKIVTGWKRQEGEAAIPTSITEGPADPNEFQKDDHGRCPKTRCTLQEKSRKVRSLRISFSSRSATCKSYCLCSGAGRQSRYLA